MFNGHNRRNNKYIHIQHKQIESAILRNANYTSTHIVSFLTSSKVHEQLYLQGI